MPNMKDVAHEARAALNRCKQKNKPTTLYDCDRGNSRRGWHVCELHYEGFDKHYGEIGNFEERWGNTQIFLAEDGKLYVHEFRGEHIGTGRGGSGKAETSHQVYLASVIQLRAPGLAYGERKPYFVGVLDGLRSLAR